MSYIIYNLTVLEPPNDEQLKELEANMGLEYTSRG